MSLFTTLDAPKQQALVEFVKAEKDRECRPLHDHIAEWMLEAIIKGDCEVTGYQFLSTMDVGSTPTISTILFLY